MTACSCGKTLDPRGVSLDWCGPGCQYRWMEQGTRPLAAAVPIWPTPARAPQIPSPAATRLQIEVAVEQAPSDPVSGLASAAPSPSRLAARWPRLGRLRMGRRA